VFHRDAQPIIAPACAKSRTGRRIQRLCAYVSYHSGRVPLTDLNRTKANPWQLKTAPGTSEYSMHIEERDGIQVLACTVGKTILYYDARCVSDLHAMLKASGGWVDLGGADEQKPAQEGTVEAWGRSSSNPVGGWYRLKKGLRGRFGVYVPPLMEALGLCELEHNAKNNRIRAR